MSHQLRQEYLNAIRERYKNSCRNKKTSILNEFCEVCGYSRKYAIAILNGQIDPIESLPRGRRIKYTSQVVYHIARLWRLLGMPGSTKFKAALPEWLKYDDHPDIISDPELSQKMSEVSRAQLDRLLKPHREQSQRG